MIFSLKNDNSHSNSLQNEKTNIKLQSEVKELQSQTLQTHSLVNTERENTSSLKKNNKYHKSKHMRKNYKKKHHYSDEYNDENIMEISVYLFVPLVIFILIATVASIAGFLYLVFNYSTATSGLEEKRYMSNKKDLQDLITILRLKNHVAKKKKKEKNQSSYKQEPESEGKVLNL